jgi:hypothetical protein
MHFPPFVLLFISGYSILLILDTRDYDHDRSLICLFISRMVGQGMSVVSGSYRVSVMVSLYKKQYLNRAILVQVIRSARKVN